MPVRFVVLTGYFDVTKTFYWCAVISYQFFVDNFFFMFGKPSASSFSGNILRNVETGKVFPCAPVSIFRQNLWMPFRFGNIMLMSTKASSHTIEHRAFHLFLSFSVVVYCISFHVLFSPILWLIVSFFVFSALWPRPLFWFCSIWQTYWCPVVCFTTCVAFWSECWTSFTVKSMAFTTFETFIWPSRTCWCSYCLYISIIHIIIIIHYSPQLFNVNVGSFICFANTNSFFQG